MSQPGGQHPVPEEAVEDFMTACFGYRTDELAWRARISNGLQAAAPHIEASVLARLRERLPHSKTVGHLNSIATLLEGMRMGAGGVPIDTKRDVDFLRDLAAALASLPDEGEL